MSENTKAHNFKADSDTHGEMSLSELLKTHEYIVLYFYPKDNTPGCTIEAKDFTCLHDEFKKLNVEIVGASKDTVEKHKNFREKQGLSIPLISDPNGDIITQFGSWKKKSMFGKTFMGIERSTYLINKKGDILKKWGNVKVKDHAQKVLDYIKSL